MELPTYRRMAGFVLPLSATSLIITLSHSVVNAGVARTPDPEIALAAYALARSLVMLIENPMFMVRQTVVSLVRDRASYQQVRRYVYSLAGLITLVLAVLGFTPLGYRVLTQVMGAEGEIARQSHLALGVLFLLPVFTVCRNLYHGVAIIARQTLLVPFSTLIRLAVMSGTIFTLAYATRLPGAVSASIAFVGAFLIESLVMRWRARPLLKDPQYFSGEPTSLDSWGISRFFMPLVVTTFVGTSLGPLINIGLARSIEPEIWLSAYSVGFGLGSLILAPIGMLHQCALTFTKPGVPQTYTLAKRFTLGFGLLASAVLAGISYTPLGPWILTHLMGVSLVVGQGALSVMRVLCILPILLAWREYLWGILMQQKVTKVIGGAKALNLAVMAAALVFLLSVDWVSPAAAGAWAMIIGELFDCLAMQWYYLKAFVRPQPMPLAR